MQSGNPFRLYITLHERGASSAFHWAILLAPKEESKDPQAKDCYAFHAVNIADHQYPRGPQGQLTWRYHSMRTSPRASKRMVARILVTEQSCTTSLHRVQDSINRLVGDLPIKTDESGASKTWVFDALDELRSKWADIPRVTSDLESQIIAKAEEARRSGVEATNAPIYEILDGFTLQELVCGC